METRSTLDGTWCVWYGTQRPLLINYDGERVERRMGDSNLCVHSYIHLPNGAQESISSALKRIQLAFEFTENPTNTLLAAHGIAHEALDVFDFSETCLNFYGFMDTLSQSQRIRNTTTLEVTIGLSAPQFEGVNLVYP
jgi:hypothetical protein